MMSNRRDDFSLTKRSNKNDFLQYPVSFKIPEVKEDKIHSTNYDKQFKKLSKEFIENEEIVIDDQFKNTQVSLYDYIYFIFQHAIKINNEIITERKNTISLSNLQNQKNQNYITVNQTVEEKGKEEDRNTV